MILYILQIAFTVFVASVLYLYDRISRLIIGPKIYAEENVEGKVAIITGANSGVGKEAALGLAKRGCKVVLGCRNLVEGKKAQDEITRLSMASPGQVDLIHLDLADLSSVRKFAETVIRKYPTIDILINNAGFYDGSKTLKKTKDGFEAHIGVNHLGHFLLTLLLLDNVKKADHGRIISVSSTVQLFANINVGDLMMEKAPSKGPGDMLPYCNSKHANSLFAKQLGEKLKRTNVTTYSVCPGVVLSNFYRNLPSWRKYAVTIPLRIIGVDSVQGAEVILYCALAKEVADSTGLFYRFCSSNFVYNRFISKNDRIGLELWDESEKLVGLKVR
jgi:NAD(P)-dependent dehydrogenase (short-subunit alcohol dehydrogenase family)